MKLLKLHVRKGIVDDDVIHAVARVDDEDFEWLSKYTWYYKVDNAGDEEKKHISVGRNPKRERKTHKRDSLVLLNRQVMGIDDPKVQVRYKDGDPLNCQKDNLYIKVDGHALRRLQLHWINDFRVKNVQHLTFPR